MRVRGLTAGAAIVLVSLAAGLSASAKSPTYFRYKVRQHIHVKWQWPVNPYNQGRRDSQYFDVYHGSGCGTSPNHAMWSVYEQNEGAPEYPLTIDFVHGTSKNPALLVDAHYSGSASAEVKIYMTFPRKASHVKVTATHQGDVVGMTITPATATLSAKKVSHC